MSLNLQGQTAGETLVLDRIRPERNERRFYALSVGVDLFGNIHLLRNWGRIGTGGRVRVDVYSGTGDAISALQKRARAKCRRGYEARTGNPATSLNMPNHPASSPIW